MIICLAAVSRRYKVSEASLSSVAPVFVVVCLIRMLRQTKKHMLASSILLSYRPSLKHEFTLLPNCYVTVHTSLLNLQMKFEKNGNVITSGKFIEMTQFCHALMVAVDLFVSCHISPEKKKTELYQELGLPARDLRFQHETSINTRNNSIILQMEVSCLCVCILALESLKAFAFVFIERYCSLTVQFGLTFELCYSKLDGTGRNQCCGKLLTSILS